MSNYEDLQLPNNHIEQAPIENNYDNNNNDDSDDDSGLTNLADLPDNLLAEAMKQLTNPNKPLLADELPKTTFTDDALPNNVDIREIQGISIKKSWENPDSIAINTSNKNSRRVICPFCLKSLVLLPNAATYVKKSIFLIHPNSSDKTDGTCHTDFFQVNSKMDFENIEVKRQSTGDNFRYLTCGDCGSGPLGVTFDSDNNKIFYVSHDRTRYGK